MEREERATVVKHGKAVSVLVPEDKGTMLQVDVQGSPIVTAVIQSIMRGKGLAPRRVNSLVTRYERRKK